MIKDFDWTQFGAGLAIAFTAFMQVYQSWSAKRRDAALKTIKEKVEVVEQHGNATLLELKRTHASIARRLVQVDDTQANRTIADEAEAAYAAALAAAHRETVQQKTP